MNFEFQAIIESKDEQIGELEEKLKTEEERSDNLQKMLDVRSEQLETSCGEITALQKEVANKQTEIEVRLLALNLLLLFFLFPKLIIDNKKKTSCAFDRLLLIGFADIDHFFDGMVKFYNRILNLIVSSDILNYLKSAEKNCSLP